MYPYSGSAKPGFSGLQLCIKLRNQWVNNGIIDCRRFGTCVYNTPRSLCHVPPASYHVVPSSTAVWNHKTNITCSYRKDHSGIRNGINVSRRHASTAATSNLSWKDHVGDARQAIREADFVALDVEYTGLHLKDDRYIGLDKCYEAHVSGAKQFIPCQVGLTAAKYLGGNRWRITPMSVYTIPSSNKFFKVSTTTLQFLKDNNFDFHSWIHHGVQHLTPSEEKEKKHSIEQRKKELEQMLEHSGSQREQQAVEFDLSSLSPEDRQMAEGIIQRIKEWISGDSNDPLEIEMESAFQRLLMHTIIGQQFPQVYSHSARRGEERVICVYKSQKELYHQQKLALESELQRIDDEVGVRQLFDEIVRHGKILVGHNCFYDILHVYQTYYGDLPESVDEFRKVWTDKFRNTLDTKYIGEFHEVVSAPQHAATLRGLFDHMCTTELGNSVQQRFAVYTLAGTSWFLPSTVLPLLHHEDSGSSATTSKTNVNKTKPRCTNKTINAEIDKKCTTSCIQESSMSQSHDAGYDSFMTCVVFILQCDRILRSKHLKWDKLLLETGLDHVALLGSIGSANNCIRLVKSQPNSINLSSMRQSDMARYFLMSGYPNSWRKFDIMKVWSPLWVSVSVIDDTSCWVIVKNDEDIRNIGLIYRMMKNPQFSLQTYDQYAQSKDAKPSVQ
ncbi:CAF1 family ribonuclease [Babesia ovis]|uniref:Poly(A)-specific ribonuclease PARN n=1 Tax=Babesia ovis TaxID=5869 RepID=A0A9W5TBW9_BABOV|nr:CAF1 family ribonuclease [Babesia ovis]